MVNAVQRNFGDHLRWWRKRRGLSQLELAGVAGTSQRHLSFLESGRAAPSPQMVIGLAAALNVSLRQQNAFLLSAGYAAVWREGKLGAPELAQVDAALDHILAQQEPFPPSSWTGIGIEARQWRGGPPRRVHPGAVPEARSIWPMRFCRLPSCGPFVVNWKKVALHFIRGVQAGAIADASAEASSLLARLLSYDGLRELSHSAALEEAPRPLLPIHLRKGEMSLRVFTTIATLGTPQDITVQEIRIESFFPMDEVTTGFFRNAAPAKRR
jgi:transcriptional regulator with XRE-family HTH domain